VQSADTGIDELIEMSVSRDTHHSDRSPGTPTIPTGLPGHPPFLVHYSSTGLPGHPPFLVHYSWDTHHSRQHYSWDTHHSRQKAIRWVSLRVAGVLAGSALQRHRALR
jgi:hypothetical protein